MSSAFPMTESQLQEIIRNAVAAAVNGNGSHGRQATFSPARAETRPDFKSMGYLTSNDIADIVGGAHFIFDKAALAGRIKSSRMPTPAYTVAVGKKHGKQSTRNEVNVYDVQSVSDWLMDCAAKLADHVQKATKATL